MFLLKAGVSFSEHPVTQKKTYLKKKKKFASHWRFLLHHETSLKILKFTAFLHEFKIQINFLEYQY